MKLPTNKSEPVVDLKKYITQIYGLPKAGKSTFASKFDDAIFIATEPGHKFLSVYKVDVQSWMDIKDTLRNLIREEHNFQTIIIDTVDNAFEMCSKHVCNELGISHESEEGYGKGWTAVKKEFKHVIDSVAQRGFGLVFISHSKQLEKEEKGVKFPYTDNSLTNSAKNYVNGLCDFIFFAFTDDEGKHWLRTKGTKNINAGDRSGRLPEVIAMDIDVLKKELAK